jgi:chorismate dehydratase
MRPLRISAISFLNTAPLMWDFYNQPTEEITENFNFRYDVPSTCAQALRMGEADIGIIPVITTATIPDLVVIPDVAIASLNQVRSILLISKKPIDQIDRVAIDTSSRTSVALTQVLLTKFFGGPREVMPMRPSVEHMLQKCDAGLIIGDPALLARTNGYYAYDLAEIWRERTGKPFVFAVWAVRKDALSEMRPGLDVSRIFQRSRDHGLEPENLDQITAEWSRKLGLTRESIHHYLTRNIHYHLDRECLDGLALYFQYAAELRLIDRTPRLEFL